MTTRGIVTFETSIAAMVAGRTHKARGRVRRTRTFFRLMPRQKLPQSPPITKQEMNLRIQPRLFRMASGHEHGQHIGAKPLFFPANGVSRQNLERC